MSVDDVVSALENLESLVRDPVTETYAIRLNREAYHKVISAWQSKAHLRLNPSALVWSPFVNAHSAQAPAISTVAPREDPEIDDEDEDGEEDEDESAPQSSKDLTSLQTKLTRSDQLSEDSEATNNLRSTGKSAQQSISGDSQSQRENDEEADDMETDSQTSENYLKYVRASEAIPQLRFEIYPPIRKSSSTPQRRPPSHLQTAVQRALQTPGTLRSSRSQGLGEFSQLPMGRRARSKLGETPSPFPSMGTRRGGNSLTGSVEREVLGSEMLSAATTALELHASRANGNLSRRAIDDSDQAVDPALRGLSSTLNGFHSSSALRLHPHDTASTAIDPALTSESFKIGAGSVRIGGGRR